MCALKLAPRTSGPDSSHMDAVMEAVMDVFECVWVKNITNPMCDQLSAIPGIYSTASVTALSRICSVIGRPTVWHETLLGMLPVPCLEHLFFAATHLILGGVHERAVGRTLLHWSRVHNDHTSSMGSAMIWEVFSGCKRRCCTTLSKCLLWL